ncbi:MAG TPA: Rieske 2Fe-2S domain-containing protein [Jatrophihabitans sp.]|nr:Rieske 2Fe-2S domain-containing protein [Jatrophihabitans sp.]
MPRWLERRVHRIERAQALDAAADRVAGLLERPLRSSARLRGLLSGTPFGHPVHPLLVAVPIGSFVAASAMDVAGEAVAARRLIALGLASAVPTAATGGSDWVYTSGAERRVGFVHATCNWLALAGYATSWRARQQGRTAAGIGWSAAGGALLSIGGWLGGHLVYARGVGVDTTAFLTASDTWQSVIAEAELADGQPHAVEVGGTSVVLVRQGDVVHALDDRCSHRGGPLHEGQVADGCIDCPWHGSSFRLADGSVQAGPASRPQRVWQVRRAGGTVQLRRGVEAGTLRTNAV